MISSVELGNFLSHADTSINFDNGVTVFVGDNGAGKSSVIDAITFALFGKHARKSNKGLIKRGETQGYSKVIFSIGEKKYQAERKIDVKGGLAAQFSENIDGRWIQVAAGERKQFGESMTVEVEKRIGLNFEKLQIASIVQQGELNSIIKAKPKEFKEMLNAIVGIDKLDIASEYMKLLIKSFREKIQNDLGHDDTHIEFLIKELEKYQKEVIESNPLKKKLLEKKEITEKELVELRRKFEKDSPKIEKLTRLESLKNDLSTYAKEAIKDIQSEINEKERKVRECEGCFDFAGIKQDLEFELKKIDLEIENTQKKMQELIVQDASLKEKLALASKLQLKDKKCPVCDSTVEKLNPLFQEKHLKMEIGNIEKKIKVLENKQKLYNKNKDENTEKLQNAKESEAILRAHSIKNEEQLRKIEREIQLQKENTKRIPLKITSGNLVEVAQLDSHTKILFESITKLENETKGFNETEFNNIKKSIAEKQTSLSEVDQKLGAVIENIRKSKMEIKNTENILLELKYVQNYIDEIKSIQDNVYNRDGSVAQSLRSWALNAISIKASEYLILLNTKIQRISLTEKSRDIGITCFSKKEVLDLESLSGGEQVSVALALRLGMASMLGSSKLNLIILDEPTIHLDAERRKALVGVLSQLSNLSNVQNPMQFIIITHDSEIFEDSTVDQIYKFESNEFESKVTAI